VEWVSNCNLCGETRFALFAQKRGTRSGQLFHIVRCRACRLTFVNPRLTEAENLALYDEAYFHGAGFDESINYEQLDERTRRGENTGIITKIRTLHGGERASRPEAATRDERIRVLDIGCGTGSLLRALEEAGGFDVWGLELSDYAAARARNTTQARVVVGDVLAADLQGATFDVINATEVIEHLRDPLAFFRRVKSLLRPNGLFIYNTGNIEGAYARALGTQWPYLHPEGHLFYYSPSTLERYFRGADLDTMRIADADPTTRRVLVEAEGEIAYSQLLYLGATNAPSLSGRMWRLLGATSTPIAGRAIARALGRLEMPIAFNRGA
jgi:2-polyprenyl-3-methyl-5-hydroxy-6-metoxy-1,4-benzoquinol methylase